MRVKASYVFIPAAVLCVFTSSVFGASTHVISGVVTVGDGTGLANVNVVADNGGPSTMTAVDGTYSIVVQKHWSGTVTASKTGWLITPESQVYNNVAEDHPNEDYLAWQPTISGYVKKSDGTPLEGVSMSTDNGGGSDTTDASGYYEIIIPYNWSGIVSATLSDYHFADKSYTNIIADQVNQDFSGYQPTISGSTGVAGTTVTVSSVGSIVSTPVYSVTVPYGWSGTVEASLADYHFPESPRSYTDVTSDMANQNFTPYQPTISGTITKEDGTPLEGVSLTADNGGGADTTGTGGHYEIVVPYDWTGQITANKLKWEITPTSYSYANITTDQTDQEFTGLYISTIIVKADGSGYVSTIQAAIDIAEDGDVVQVEDGTYTGDGNRDIDFLGKAITVRGNVSDPNLVVINCQGTEAEPHRGFKFVSGEDIDSVLEGLKITNGYSPIDYSTSSTWHEIYDGFKYPIGGALYVWNSSPVINSCFISNNYAQYSGGIHVYKSHAIFEDCTIENNIAEWSGGGIGLLYTFCTIKNSKILNNQGMNGHGGGIYGSYAEMSYGDVSIENSVLSGNSAGQYGGGIYNHRIHLTLNKNTITENSAVLGGGIYNHSYVDTQTTIENSVLWSNANGQLYNSRFTVEYSDVEDGYTGSGNMNLDPLFESDGYHLMSTSPCINVGSPGYTQGASETDIDGNPRVVGGRIDMGADEFATAEPFILLDNDSLTFTALEARENPVPQIVTFHNLGLRTLSFQSDADVDWINPTPISGSVDYTQTGSVNVDLDITELSAGDYTGQIMISDSNAINSPEVIDVNLVVIGPSLAVSQNDYSFIASKETIDPESQILTILNTAGGTLNWNIASDCNWISIVPGSGSTTSESSDVLLDIDAADIEYGAYSCQLLIDAPNAENSPQIVTVTLDVLGPEIAIAPSSLSFECDVDEPNMLTQTLSISNSGYDVLDWEITEDCDWLTVSPVSGQCVSGPNEVTLTVDTAEIEIGYYNYELTIAGENASNSPVTVPVSLHVYRDGERHVPIEYSTIQEAIGAARIGDHVVIHPGRYQATIDIYKSITIRSVDPENMETVERTILSEAGNGGVYLGANTPGIFPVIEGLTFANFRYIPMKSWDCDPTIRYCIFKNNYLGWGAIVQCTDSNALFENCIFKNNAGYSIIRLDEYNSSAASSGYKTVFRNCLFAENTMWIEPAGCIHVDQTSAVFENCTIAYNYSVSNGPYRTIPAIEFMGGSVTINNSVIHGNRGMTRNPDNSLSVVETAQIAIVDNILAGIPKCQIAYSQAEGGQDSILLFPEGPGYPSYFYDYLETGMLPDPNLIDPNMLSWGRGNLDVDPIFSVEPNDVGDGWAPLIGHDKLPNYNPLFNNIPGDYHLKSQMGHFVWDGFARADFNFDKHVDLVDFSGLSQNWALPLWYPWDILEFDLDNDRMIGLGDVTFFCDDYLQPRVFGAWVTDDETSPCIDAGDPNDIDWHNELWPHGGRVNMGAYGGTPQASLSLNTVGNPADLNHDDAVDIADWSLWSDDWLTEQISLDSDFDRNNVVDPNDLNIFLNNWLWQK